MKAVLISTYDLGRQPFGLASPAAWLRAAGVEVRCLDLSVDALDEAAIRIADLVAFFLPMHTATRLAIPTLRRVRDINPAAHLCAYGLYAPMNASLLRDLGVRSILGGEFEEGLVNLVRRLAENPPSVADSMDTPPLVSLARQRFQVPDRHDLPPLSKYAQLVLSNGARQIVGYTEASRGCKHLCRHCPIVPVYRGRFRIVQSDVILEDIRRQVTAGAQHITFGDPDFFNGIKHAVEVISSLHDEFPNLTYDVTIKIEHLLKHADYLGFLQETGCAFVTSAVESLDDRVLDFLQKHHTRADFFRVVELLRQTRLVLVPTFVAFHPWTTLESYHDFLTTLASLELVEHVPPVQLAIRLLIPAGSLLLELADVHNVIQEFDTSALSYRWRHPDPRVDSLQQQIEETVKDLTVVGATRSAVFAEVWRHLLVAMDRPLIPIMASPARTTIPYLTEPWFC